MMALDPSRNNRKKIGDIVEIVENVEDSENSWKTLNKCGKM